ncbi:MAG: thymidine phosphorylase family protein [Xanthobacteraceae bacterium]|nr:thymidine phosphorylase family protein [Xanthobacteraceae bacterium]
MIPEAQPPHRADNDVPPSKLRARRLGIDTQHEAVVFMRHDCHVCRSEGLTAHARIQLTHGQRSIIATLYHVRSDLLQPEEAGLSEPAWRRLGLKGGEEIVVSHAPTPESLSRLRAKVYGQRLDEGSLGNILSDVVAGRYSDIHLSSFITACAARSLDRPETTALTRAMVDIGDKLEWNVRPVMDKHSVGGLPGNRTTPIVVAIVAAHGLTIPKTSSRAITSPAGTADTMETMAPVDLDIAAMRRVVEREGGCIVWGGAVRLSPADDILIRIERALDLDNGGQLVASVLSKKVAAGSTHLVIDMPVGPTAKIRTPEAAAAVSASLLEVSEAFGIRTKIVAADGTQPVGRGIGPALEARDVLSVLQNAADAPADLRERALALAGALLELAEVVRGDGLDVARQTLADGRAWKKFQRICEAQGGMRQPPLAAHQRPQPAEQGGHVSRIDNRRIAKVAKLAGAPDGKAAGVQLLKRLGDRVEPGEPLFVVHAETRGELAYAMQYLAANRDIVTVADG